MKLLRCLYCVLSLSASAVLNIAAASDPLNPEIDVTGTWEGQATSCLTQTGQIIRLGLQLTFQLTQTDQTLEGLVSMPPCFEKIPIVTGSIFREIGASCDENINQIKLVAKFLGVVHFEIFGTCSGVNSEQQKGPYTGLFVMETEIEGCPNSPSVCNFSVSRTE